MSKIVSYLRLGRLHTAALTLGITTLSAVLATGTFLDWRVPLFTFFGILFHFVGFGHNGIIDYKEDRKDPHKQHMPLVSGELRFGIAAIVVGTLFLVGLIWGMFMAGQEGAIPFWESKSIPASFALIATVSFGLAYNYASKRTGFSCVLIGLSYGFLAVFPYYALGGSSLFVVGALFGYFFMQTLFSVFPSGYYKDMRSDEVNPLRRLGAKILGGRYCPTRAVIALVTFLKLSGVGFGASIGYYLYLSASSPVYAISFLMSAVFFWFSYAATGPMRTESPFTQKNATRVLAMEQMFAYFGFVFTLVPLLGAYALGALTLLPVLWFFGMNRILWGKGWTFQPKV